MAQGIVPRALFSAAAAAAGVPGGNNRQLARLNAVAQLFSSRLSRLLGWRGGHMKLAPINRFSCSPWVRKDATLSSSVEATPSVRAMAEGAGKSSFIVVYVTVPDSKTGTKLAGSIVSKRLAACVNQVPSVQSTYWWEGKVHTDAEELLIIKTQESLLEALTSHVKAEHPYTVPEVIALPILGGSSDYLKWLGESTKEASASGSVHGSIGSGSEKKK